ncbi:hypothetical protein E4T56_gene180 [Termitomyces sp. T112]|nr:hypothetical protein E4T56_gene180 [Termitomyces sp. T112]
MEDNLGATVVDIPVVSQGANYYGFQMKLSNSMNIMARLARDDVNIPDFCGFLHKQVMEVKFEAAAYKLLSSEPHILASRLLYHRVSMQHADPRQKVPQDILDRRLMIETETFACGSSSYPRFAIRVQPSVGLCR